jgi:hypothetical protein
MTAADALTYHMKELGIVAKLTADARNLELDAPEGVLTPEFVGLVRDHKDDLVESFYLLDEADAIAWEGCQLSEVVANTGRYHVGALVFPCTPDGTRLHNEAAAITEARQLESGAWQYRLEGFTQWRAHRELQE